ncbi:MAG: heat shock protein HspQ, partial [Gammaproteobacteria bacterium]
KQAKFSIGQCIHHRLFDYRGVIVDVDPEFLGEEEWYQAMARTRPPRNEPWYHVLVHDTGRETYVAERNLQVDETNEPINHPLVQEFFTQFEHGQYHSSRHIN